MSPLLMDTNVYTAYKRGDAGVLAVLQQATELAISPVVLGELYGGFALGSRNAANRQELAAFLALPQVTVLPIDADTALQYATVYADLRRAGRPIPTNDLWIAASAMQHGCDLFSFDAHFQAISGLRAGSSLADFQAP